MGDPWAAGITQGVHNYAIFSQLAEQKKLRRLQEQEAQQKLDEINREKAGMQNLSDIVAARGGVWKGDNPTGTVMSPTGQVNMPQAIPGAETFASTPAPDATMETPSVPVDVSREPTAVDFQNRELGLKQELAKTNPKLYFEQMGLENTQERQKLQTERTRAQVDRLKGMTERAAKLSPELAAAIQATMHNAMSGIMDPGELENQVIQYQTMFETLNGRKGKSKLGTLGGKQKSTYSTQHQSLFDTLRANPNNKDYSDQQLHDGIIGQKGIK